MRINHNIAALNTYNKLSANQATTAKSLEKLSSGLKINKAGDNAAGLAISEKMRGQIRGLDQASTNANDAISLINTAEGALSETHSILQRMRELAVQSSNDTNVDVDRGEIQKEMNQLTNEINRIGNTTEFNTKKLLDGGGSKLTSLQVSSTVTGGKAGDISTVGTKAASATGKATTSIAFTNTAGTSNYTLSISAQDASEDLNGYNFVFANDDGYTAQSGTVTLASNTVTITGKLSTLTASGIQTLLNTQGLAANPVTVKVVNSGGVVFAGALAASGATALTGKTTASMVGGTTEDRITRGVYEFELKEAFVNSGASNTFTIRVQGSGGAVASFKDIALVATSGVTASGKFSIGQAGSRLSEDAQAANIATALNETAGFKDIYTATAAGSKITITENADHVTGTAVQKISSAGTAAQGIMEYQHSAQNLVDVGGKFTVDGVDIQVVDDVVKYAAELANGTAMLKGGTTASGQNAELVKAITKNTTLVQKYTAASGVGVDADKLILTQTAANRTRDTAVMTLSDKAGNGFQASFQIGANTSQSMTIEVEDMRSAALKVAGKTEAGSIFAKNGAEAKYTADKNITDGTTNSGVEYALDVSTHENATAAISVINDAIESVSAERSKLGSYQNRLEHTINNLSTSSENMTSAESRIRDVDMAKEMMEFTKNNILSQAAQSMLAQANQQPQGVLQLLQ